jgi:hypothetical protein
MERTDELRRRTFDHFQRIHGVAPSDLPPGSSVGDEHSADHETGRFQHRVDDLFLFIDEDTSGYYDRWQELADSQWSDETDLSEQAERYAIDEYLRGVEVFANEGGTGFDALEGIGSAEEYLGALFPELET